ncbi:MAG: 23S rRNA (adenine(2503)-C(2))-methyltransferase RlmN [Chthonomonadales bacterium]
MSDQPARIILSGMSTTELEALAVQLGEKRFRGRQIAEWLYTRFVRSIDEMSNLPAPFRAKLNEVAVATSLTIFHKDAAEDGTIKYLAQLHDGEEIEAVYLPYENRVSICISSQVGCAAGCTFCATAQGGLARDLTAGEIFEQYLLLANENPGRRISHIVYMGMGEPLLNYEAVVGSARLLMQEAGLSARHITISTVGVVPGILRLAEEHEPITLAVSLHAPDDVLREQLIPTAKKWKLEQILDACKVYHQKTKRNLTFEYLLIGGVNDSLLQARDLAKVLGDIPGNVNLIPFNYVDTAQGFKRPKPDRIQDFRTTLEVGGRITTQRMERGHGISAACGQLKRTAGTIRVRNISPKLNVELTPVG